MINIYFNTQDNEDWLRLSPSGTKLYNGCNFIFNESELDKFNKIDYIVVFNQFKPIVDKIKFNTKNSLVFACEPPSIKTYSNNYLNQFEYAVSSDSNSTHKNLILSTTFFPWHIGINRDEKLNYGNLNFQKLKNLNPQKKKNISLIRTNKSMCKEHDIRNEIYEKIISEFNNEIDVYGRDDNFISDKKDALLDYRYHICIENYFGMDFWTEKLSDPLIAKCNPIYLGCTNLNKYFTQNFYKIKKDDIKYNFQLIEKILKKTDHRFEFEKSRELIFEKFNIFNFITKFVKTNITNLQEKFEIKTENMIVNTKTLKYRLKNIFK